MRFWLFACDALERVGLFPSRAWDYCIERAAACVEYDDEPASEDSPW
jgi:hypothetical protein